MRRDAMRTIAVVLFVLSISTCLLNSSRAQAALVQDCISEAAPSTRISPGAIQLAGAFQMSNAKLADKYLAGKAGGRYGIGGTESVIFKKKKKK
jgi:hypothetical protein